MANPTTNYGWPMPTSTDLVTDLPADFAAFGQPVDTSLKALNPETTLGDIAYRSATSNTNTRLGIGTAGQVLAVSGGVPAWTTTADVTPLTTKGDLFTFSTVDARLGVGTNNQILVADSAEATGLKWATPAAATSGYTFISRSTFSAVATADIDGIFTSTYETYQVVIETSFSSTDSQLKMQLRYAGGNTQSADGYYGVIRRFNGTYTSDGGTNISNGTNFLINDQIRTGVSQASNSTFTINQVGNGSRNPILYGIGNSCSYIVPTICNGYMATGREYTGIRLAAVTGNLTAQVSVYGLAKA